MEEHYPTSTHRSLQFDWQSSSHSKHRFTSHLHTQSLLTLVGSSVVGVVVVCSTTAGVVVVVVVCFTTAGTTPVVCLFLLWFVLQLPVWVQE